CQQIARCPSASPGRLGPTPPPATGLATIVHRRHAGYATDRWNREGAGCRSRSGDTRG
ncbi:MAG: hypothetical protein AVDCRST_MAG59-503, partial [uncultured Thermomicrobiales bacterium]